MLFKTKLKRIIFKLCDLFKKDKIVETFSKKGIIQKLFTKLI